ncbi:hypothetical protein JOC86_001691 [Bacillus pakistanensis]|uniref:Uncharacterized protein n=1 Tax=Rossellomorea pakistanensis TaxID=992288 RepID=A0ABS2NBB5_9BACI|nr:hypothetical protein [Bacillus pakistanensis]MBM7585149.1 hypothetical protein [Bacillus pakistanensis]
MKMSRERFEEAGEFIKRNGRSLEAECFRFLFEKGKADTVIAETVKYQNEDGGFGHGMESDFRLPLSSPLATSVGLRHLVTVGGNEAETSIRKAIQYLEKTYDVDRKGWFAVSKEVNDYPHTPWWHFNEKEGLTVIDYSWGNPTAEILAYLYQNRQFVHMLNIDDLVITAISKLENKVDFQSEHELYCYVKLHEVLPNELKNRLEAPLKKGVQQLIQLDESKWNEYVPTPLDFVKNPAQNDFGIPTEKIEKNLDFLLEELVEKGKISPSWGKSFYGEGFENAYEEWQGVLTLDALIILAHFDRIDE